VVEITGGVKFDDWLRKIAQRVGRTGVVRVGFLEDATYPDGTSVATVAAIQNFGAPVRGIPPRDFFSRMVREQSPRWGGKFARILQQTDYDVDRSLGLMGEGIAGQLREYIVATNSPPLSAITLMLRKMKADDPDLVVTGATVGEAARRVAAGEDYGGVSTKALVDTGHMLASVDYEVETGVTPT
jgi:hypothetical protein